MSLTVEMEDHVCCVCGIAFSIPVRIGEKRRENGECFYCPNGHNLSYAKGENAKLKEQLASKEREATLLRADLYKANDDKQKAQRKLGRLEKGVCHKCNRFFPNVARHMKAKHS